MGTKYLFRLSSQQNQLLLIPSKLIFLAVVILHYVFIFHFVNFCYNCYILHYRPLSFTGCVSKMSTIMSDINACLLLWKISWYDVFFWCLVSSNTSFSKVPLNILPCGPTSLWHINTVNQYLPSTPISFETVSDDDLWPNIIVIHFIVTILSSFATDCSFRLASTSLWPLSLIIFCFDHHWIPI